MSNGRPPLSGRRPVVRLLCVVAAVVLAGGVTGCAVNAGSAANARFERAMDGVDGVVRAEGNLTNPLPFSGSGSIVVWIDAEADREVLGSAVERALDFDAGPNVRVDAVIVGIGEGEYDDFENSYADRITIDEPGAGADEIVDTLLALHRITAVSSVEVGRSGIALTLTDGADPCLTVAAVAEELGGPEQPIEVWNADGEPEEVLPGCALLGGML